MMKSILIADDNEEFVSSTKIMLELINYSVDIAHDVATAKNKLKHNHYSHLLLDLMLPDGSGLNILEDLSKARIEKLCITMITGHPSMKMAVTKMMGPNINYLMKPVSFKKLRSALEQPHAVANTNNENKSTLSRQGSAEANSHSLDLESEIIGRSAAIKELRTDIKLLSKSSTNVMLLGESGVGKEVVAHAIHKLSNSNHAFVAANCGAFSRELIASELFGHEKGAFTGALEKRKGVFELAHKGTLFLDEITEMPLDLQPILLRAIETQSIARVGSTVPIPAECRIVSASNRSEVDIATKQVLREDLYYRLAVYPITIPPLRQRIEDIPLLANHFLDKLNHEHDTEFELGDKEIDVLSAYSWPGNIRELKNLIRRAFIKTDATAKILRLPNSIQSPFHAQISPAMAPSTNKRLDEVEKELILATLDRFGGDKRKTAQILGVSTKTIYNRLITYGLNHE